MKTIFSKNAIIRILLLFPLWGLGGCQEKFDVLPINPNVAGEESAVPASYLLGRVMFELYNGGGVTDGRAGSVYEGPWEALGRYNQYVSGNNIYGGNNAYGWTATATMYNVIKNIDRMEAQAAKSLSTKDNTYTAIGKFLRAYSFIWLTQRVGDIPMTEAGKGLDNLTPKFDTQKDVYAKCLQLLEEANTDLTVLIPKVTSATNIEGDIFFGNSLAKWQQAINSYKLRVLISLSKRADDTADLGIKQKFADVINNPAKYPIFKSNADNWQFTFNAQYNQYPTFYLTLYADQVNVSATYLSILTEAQDPRTFLITTPAPAQIKAGKTIGDFAAYNGAPNGRAQSEILNRSLAGEFSFTNFNRYLSPTAPTNAPEPYVMVGYAEQCFNIAEAINRGWVVGNATTFYNNGINASLAFYGLTEGRVLSVGDAYGKAYGNVTISVADFLKNANVVYKGNNTDGLTQILKQKYVAMFQNSGWEPFYNQRRTGVPAFSQGPGTNSTERIPRRWRYPADELNNNGENVKAALQSQFGGTDDIYASMWLLK